jgi:hypothetical protein
MAVTYMAAGIFVLLIDVWSYSTLGVLLLPNLYWALLMFVITPLACIMSVLANVIVSSRVADIRAAQQIGGLVVCLVFVVIFGSMGSSKFDVLATVVSIALAAADVGLFYLSKPPSAAKKSSPNGNSRHDQQSPLKCQKCANT